MSKEPRLDIATEKAIVIDNIPKVGTDKKEKLKNILNKLVTTYGKIQNEYYPEGENGILNGYKFKFRSNFLLLLLIISLKLFIC